MIEHENNFRANEVILEREETLENLELLESPENRDQLDPAVNQDPEDHEVNQVSEATPFKLLKTTEKCSCPTPREATSKRVCLCKALKALVTLS